MNCLPCFSKEDDDEGTDQPQPPKRETPSHADASKDAGSSTAQTFTFRELAMATKNFRQECMLGEGAFGRVFKGKLHSSGQVVAVKQLDRNGMQGNKEFLVEVMMLSLLQHPNLLNLIGYCADGDQRLLVYEFMPMGSLEEHLFGDSPEKKPMDWCTRMKIASGAAKGLEYLHEKTNPPIIYRDIKPSNVLLNESYEPKLSDVGLAKLGAGGGKMHPSSRVMGTYGYSAPEYSSSGELTLKSDIYSFGVVLLELITGRRVIDTTRPNDEQNLVTWAQPIFREPKRFPEMADLRLNKEFPLTSLNQAVGIAAMCLQEEASVRPLIGDVVAALGFLAIPQPNTGPAGQIKDDVSNAFAPPPQQSMHYGDEVNRNRSTREPDGSSEDSEDEQSDRGRLSERPNEDSCRDSVGESWDNMEGESGPHSNRRSSDRSEEESADSDADIMEDDDRSEVGNLSSSHGSSRRSSKKRTGSRTKKIVVTFMEPSLSSKRNSSKKLKEESDSYGQPVGTDVRRDSTSSSSESSGESEDENGCSRHKDERARGKENGSSVPYKNGKLREGTSSSIDRIESHRGFDEPDPDGPRLRHLQNR